MTAIIASADQSPTNGGAFKVGNIHHGQSRGDLSTQWLSRPADQRFLSLDLLRDFLARRAETTTEFRPDVRKIEFLSPEVETLADTHKLTVGLPDGTELAPNHWSFGQLCGLAQAPASYLRKLPRQIVSDALEYGMRYNRPSEVIKTYGGDGTLYAATGPDYGRIFDHEVVSAVQQIAGAGTGDMRWKVPGVLDWSTMTYDPNVPVSMDTTTLFASDRDLFLFLVDDRHPIEIGKLHDGSPDYVFRGFYITNSEVGSGALKIAVFYLRAICCNRIMWGVEGFEEISLRHSKYAPARFVEEARPALLSFAEGSVKKLVEGVEKAKAAKVAETQDDAIAWLQNRGFTKKRVTDVLEAVEREEKRPARTIWDMAQGITAVARTIPNNDDRVGFELEARRILDKVAA